jgi:hypothetical protein
MDTIAQAALIRACCTGCGKRGKQTCIGVPECSIVKRMVIGESEREDLFKYRLRGVRFTR